MAKYIFNPFTKNLDLLGVSSSYSKLLLDKWVDATRELHPTFDKVGYNTQRERVEFYMKDVDKWYYMWQAEIDSGYIPVTFNDSFEK